jgi:Nif-specific regulatory protein
VLLRGESGTGKELFAAAIHRLSGRRDKSLVKLNCAALSENLLESELFGHEKGAFTGAIERKKGRFELADGGTLFLDEIGEISPAFQVKLLRALQEGEFERVGGSRTIRVDVRLVTATNRDLEAAVVKGEFRADLYFRICVVPITLPPLRERRSDIPALAQTFLDRFNHENRADLAFSRRALDHLAGCNFPGNIRELENCVNRVATLATGPVIDVDEIACVGGACPSPLLRPSEDETAAPDGLAEPATAPPPMPAAAPGDEAGDPAARARQELIDAMEKSGWVQAKAARLLGLTPRQIAYALKKHGIDVVKF